MLNLERANAMNYRPPYGFLRYTTNTTLRGYLLPPSPALPAPRILLDIHQSLDMVDTLVTEIQLPSPSTETLKRPPSIIPDPKSRMSEDEGVSRRDSAYIRYLRCPKANYPEEPSSSQPLCPTVTIQDSPSGPQYVLSRHAHNPSELAFNTIRSFVDRDKWTTLQSDALRAIQEILPAMYNIMGHGQVPCIENMQCFIDLFGAFFFLDNLNELQFEWVTELEHRLSLVGCAVRLEGRFTIFMDPEYFLAMGNPAAYTLGVLLHECAHTFFNMYCCECHHSPDCVVRCNAFSDGELGRSGHGEAWVQLASRIEEVARAYIDPHVSLFIARG